MRRLQKVTGLALMLCSATIVSCSWNKVPNVPASAATVHCAADCVAVSKAFVKEHADLFDQLIRAKAALAICENRR